MLFFGAEKVLKMKNPKVSILIPTYNQEKYIGQALESALAQSYTNKEIVVSDDRSTDQTGEIAKKWEKEHPEIRYFCNTENTGRVANYHKALYEYATGDLAINLDGDDYFCDNSYIEQAVRLFEKHPDLVLVFADKISFFEKQEKFIKDKNNRDLPALIDGNWLFINYHKKFSVAHLSSIYNRHEAIKSGYYLHEINSADWESMLRMILNRKVAYISRYVGVWRKHSNNASRSIKVEHLIDNALYVEKPYEKALKHQIFPTQKLNFWRKKLLKRWFLNAIVKVLFLDKKQIGKLLYHIKNYDAGVYQSIIRDPRFWALRILAVNPKLLAFVLKSVFQQKSFVYDLQKKA